MELAKNVMENCAEKLRPNLTEAMKYLGTTLDDYSDFVAAVCDGRICSPSDDETSSSAVRFLLLLQLRVYIYD